MLELVIALTVITLSLLGFFFATYSTFRATQLTEQRDDVRVAVETLTELMRKHDYQTLHNAYHGKSVEIPGLEGPDGSPATIDITCYVDETNLPDEFGPVIDLDGKEGMETRDCSGSYELLPVKLHVEYLDHDVVQTHSVYLLIAEQD
jgi:hypothetical protein